ncbi:MAG: hypothetical protein QW717_07380 [Candidatus Bathyarchaeia archaeon]
MGEKYREYIQELFHLSFGAANPFRKGPLIMDSHIMPSLKHFIEVYLITGSGTNYIQGRTFEIPPETAEKIACFFHSGLPIEPKGEINPPLYREGNRIVFQHKPMYHTVDELFLFIGINPSDIFDLGGDVELWLGLGKKAEKYIISKPSLVYIPAGLVHGPLVFRNVRRPFVQVIINESPTLDEHGVDEWPPDYKPE